MEILTIDWAFKYLQENREKLHLTDTVMCNRDLAVEILVKE
jgi:hypothetical protein